ncbi:MAG: ABC-F family ATP-binding cassette domain-containing protein [Balneolaceae bacterium]
MLQLQNIELTLGQRPLFDGVSALINPGERVGLVGPNGAGKSTLLKVIAGERPADGGDVILGNGATVGYLPQDGVDPDPKKSVFEEVESGFPEILSLRKEVEHAQQQLETLDPESAEGKRVLERFGRLQSRLEQSGSWTLTSDIERILSGLGFSETDFSRSTTEFSGGWLMRIALARLLLRRPMFLLLDEPTNHLDIESLDWMERFLASYEGAVIIVSHDRAFLDTLTTRTLALDAGALYDYAGNYSFYEKKFAQEQELLERQAENQAKQIKETEEFIDRFRYKATKAKQVQSRIKQLEKLERIQTRKKRDEISFRFPQPERSGQIVMELKGADKSYGEHVIFDGLDYQISRGDKVAVVGPNGAGKSTLIRMLAGNEALSGGERRVGHNVTPVYFAQHQADDLETSKTILEEMTDHAGHVGETQIRSLLGCFLFTGEDVFKKISVLSGGEKSRVALAKMLITPANFLILDEPTNHLDMDSKEILQEALSQYEGTCMIVSHDRAFLDPIVSHTLEIQPGFVKSWPGNVSNYLAIRAQRREAESGHGKPSQPKSTSGGAASDSGRTGLSKKEERRIRAQKRKAEFRTVGPLRKRLSKLEESIQQKESRRDEIEDVMARSDFYDDPEQVKTVSMEYEELRQELSDHYSKWEELAGRIDYLEQETSDA